MYRIIHHIFVKKKISGFLSKLVDKKDVTDPFVDVCLGKTKMAKTRVISNDLNPQWNEKFRLEVCHFAKELKFEIRDKDHARQEFIGSVEIPTADLMTGEIIEDSFPIRKKNGSERGKLSIRIEFR